MVCKSNSEVGMAEKGIYRDTSIDLVGGGMIIYMLFGHIISWANLNSSVIYIWTDRLLFFFMPWFFFKSGMFYNGKSSMQQWENRKKILSPFFFWGLLGILTFYLTNCDNCSLSEMVEVIAKNLLLRGTFEGNHALWFLFSLLIVKCVYPLLLRILQNWQIILFTGILTIAFLALKGRVFMPDYICNSIGGLFFYSFGVEMKDRQYSKKVVVLSLITFIVILICIPSRVALFHLKLIEGSPFLWIIAAVAGIIIVNNIGAKMSGSKFVLCNVLTYIGQNSMIFFVSHFIIGNMVNFFLKEMNIHIESRWGLASIYAFSFIIIIPILTRVFQRQQLKILIGK